MPRAFKRDSAETAKRGYADSRSFVALGSGCEVLFGADKEKRRREIYDRAHGRCEAEEHAPTCKRFVNWDDEWHHTRAHDSKKCDCMGAGLFVTKACHRYAHRRRNPRWSRKREAVNAFNNLYGEAK